tara:strand:+ start:385 stop:1185 length:801 start_codon:yes stop_codon:yes gene_type:complete
MNVLVSVASSDYIKYFLPMIQSAIDEGKWDGDFCLIVKDDIEWEVEQELKSKGIHIFKASHLPENPTIHWYKIYLFDEYFKKWDWILYCDLDVLFLNPIELNLSERDKKLIYTKKDDLTFMEHFSIKESEEKQKIYKKYGNGDAIQTCFLLFHSSMIDSNYFEKLYDAYLYYYCKYKLNKNVWWDQSIFNIVFFKKWLDIGFEFIAINPIMNQLEWDLSKLNNPYMDTADYSNTTALHFFNFATPWDEKNLRFYPIWKKYNKKTIQ